MLVARQCRAFIRLLETTTGETRLEEGAGNAEDPDHSDTPQPESDRSDQQPGAVELEQHAHDTRTLLRTLGGEDVRFSSCAVWREDAASLRIAWVVVDREGVEEPHAMLPP